MVVRDSIKSKFPSLDLYVRKHSNSVCYQLTEWGQACFEAYKHTAFNLVAEDDGHIVGVLPLVYIKPPFISGELVSMPFCDTGGAIYESTEIHQSLISKAISLGNQLKVKHIDLRCIQACHELEDMNEAVKLPLNKVTVILKLQSSAEELLAGFKSKLRSQIRKAGKNGLEFNWVTVDKIDDFFGIYAVNMKSLGSPIHSKKWFTSLVGIYQERIKIGVVYSDGIPVGAGIIMFHGSTVAVPWASTLKEYNHLAPNMLLYWNLLKYAADSGFSYFDFGRATPGEGTYKFKLQWGGEPSPLHWYRISIKGTNDKVSSSVVKGGGLAGKVWRKLPLCVANYLGPRVRKYISL